jgi:phosphoglycolate phosphatase
MNNAKGTLIFDFDGTLCNSIDLLIALYNEHASEYGYERLSKAELPCLRRMGYKRAMRAKKVRLRRTPKIIAELSGEMRKRMNEVQPYEGIVQVLKELQREGYRLGVLTSNQVALVSEFFNVHSFPEFDFVVSERTIFGKGKALKRIIRAHQLDPRRVVYVGDEPRDVTASRKAGVRVIGVSWGIGGVEGFEVTAPDMLVHTPQEFAQAARTLLQE